MAYKLGCMLVLLSGSVWASISPSTCTFNMQVGGPVDYSCAVAVTNAGSWSASVGGSAHFRVATANGTQVTSTSGSKTVYVQLYDSYYWVAVAAGTYTDSTNVVIDGTTVSITVNVVAASANPTYSNVNGTADSALGCTKPTSWQFYANCAVSNQRPGGTFNLPALGSSYTDSLFGSTACQVAPLSIGYPGLRSFSSDGAYVLTAAPSTGSFGIAGVYPTTCTGTRAYTHPRSVDSTYINCQWSTIHALYVYCLYDSSGYAGATSIYRVHGDGAGNWVNDGAIWTEPHGKNIFTGATNPIWEGDRIAVITEDISWLHSVNLESGTTESSIDLSTVSPTIAGPASSAIDYTYGPIKSDSLGRYYIKLAVEPGAQTYPVARWFYYNSGSSTITYAGMGTAYWDTQTSSSMYDTCNTTTIVSGSCNPGAHSFGIKFNSEPYIGFATSNADIPIAATMRLSDGLVNMQRSVNVSGGMLIAGNMTDYMSGALTGAYVATSRTQDGAKTGYYVTALSTGTTTTMTFSPDPGWSGGQAVLCGGFTGVTGLTTGANALTVVASLGSAQYTFTTTTSGTYDANSGACTTNSTPSTYYGQEVQVMHLSTSGGVPVVDKVYRIAQHRSIAYTNLNYYEMYARVSLSNDGSKVIWQTNGGVPNGPVVMMMATVPSSPSLGSSRKGNTTTKGPVVIR